jgi:rubrerythrin
MFLMSDGNVKEKAEILKMAIKSEIDGCNFYDLLAKESKNEDAKRRLENLRDDEVRHKKQLTTLYKKLVGTEPESLPEEGIGPLVKVFKSDKVDGLKSETTYINLAIDAEISAMKFYKEAAESYDDEEIKSMLMRLSDEENGHYQWLMAERQAMAGNYFWFGEMGSSPMEE